MSWNELRGYGITTDFLAQPSCKILQRFALFKLSRVLSVFFEYTASPSLVIIYYYFVIVAIHTTYLNRDGLLAVTALEGGNELRKQLGLNGFLPSLRISERKTGERHRSVARRAIEPKDAGLEDRLEDHLPGGDPLLVHLQVQRS